MGFSMKIMFYAKAPDATKHYRVDIPVKYLNRSPGVIAHVEYAEKLQIAPGSQGFRAEDLKDTDIVVLQRPVTPGVEQMIDFIHKNYPKIPVVCDYDDDYFSVPRWNPGYPHLKMFEKYWRKIVEKMDGAICSTEPLSDMIRKHSKKTDEIVTIGNGFDFEAFDTLTPVEGPPMIAPSPEHTDKIIPLYNLEVSQFNELTKNKTVCAWAGSKFHYVDLDWIPESIRKVSEETDDIVFLFIGYMQGNLVKASKINHMFLSKGAPGVLNFYRMLMGLNIDIMLAPLDPNTFNRSKSNLKLVESMALGAYPICSAWDPYELDLEDDDEEMDQVHGRLVDYQPYEWARAIMEVSDKIKNAEYKKKYRSENNAYLRCTHDAELRTEKYLAYFNQMIDRKK